MIVIGALLGGDARNDLRFAAGVLPGNWMVGTARCRSPHLLTTGFRSKMVGVFVETLEFGQPHATSRRQHSRLRSLGLASHL